MHASGHHHTFDAGSVSISSDQGDLSAQQRALLEQLIDARIQQDGGDAGQSLANLSSSLPFADKLVAMHDDALAVSLSKLPPAVYRAWPGSDSESHSSRESGQSHESATSDDWLHPIYDRFEAAWREHVNAAKKSEPSTNAQLPAPRLEDFLCEVPDKQQKIALRELLIIELHWRRKKGENPDHKSYQRRFPDWSHVVDDAFNLANGRYQVEESFAKGGLGEVFIARDLELNRPVAFKCVRADRDRDESRKRLVIEGEITGGLEHPGIVPVYGLGHFQDGRPFYAMRFIKGENLRRALRKFHGLPLENEDPKLAETELLPESTRSSSVSRSDQPVASASLFDRKRLEFRELLGRFVDVCQALAYAHDRKVLHRDLKPGNIMLGKYGETLVVDWGLAKTLGRKEELTPFDPRHTFDGPVIPSSGSDLHLTRDNAPAGQAPLIGTLAYISPEQAAGKLEELGAATDIFSLGATLFELLTGQPPIGAVLPGAAGKRLTQKDVEEAARKGEFPRPRQLLPEVPASLEAVCLKAMSFQPQDRYPTAKALAEDIERWLADEPVSVWREPFNIRAQRWMKLHRTAVATTAATFLMSFLGVIGWGLISAEHTRQVEAANTKLRDANTQLAEANVSERAAKQDADQKLKQFTAINNFLVKDLLTAVDPERAKGHDITIKEVLDNASAKVGIAFQDQPIVEAELRATIGHTYEAIGDYDAAKLHSVKVLDIRNSFLGEQHPDTAIAMNNLALILKTQGLLSEAERLFRAAYDILSQKLSVEHAQTNVARNNLAALCLERGANTEAERLLREAIPIQRKISGGDDVNTIAFMDNLSVVLNAQGKLSDAARLNAEALNIKRRVLGDSDPRTLISMNNQAAMFYGQGMFTESAKMFRTVFEIQCKVLGSEHPETQNTRTNLAAATGRNGNLVDAEKLLRESIDIQHRIFGEAHRESLGSTFSLAGILADQGKSDEAEALFRRVLETARREFGNDAPQTRLFLGGFASSLAMKGDIVAAEPLHQEIVLLQRKALPSGHPEIAIALQAWALNLIDGGQPQTALPVLRECLEIRQKALRAGHPEIGSALVTLGWCLTEIDQSNDAEKLIRDGLEIRRTVLPKGHWHIANSESILRGCLTKVGQFQEAEQLLLKSHVSLKSAKGVPPQRLRQALDRIIDLYTTWDQPEAKKKWQAVKDESDAKPK